jgi:hypothetical protein
MSTTKAHKAQEEVTAPGSTGEPVQAKASSPFDDLESLRISQDFTAQSGVKKVLLTVPVGRRNKQAFVRVNPKPEYRMDLACLELKDDRETFIVDPTFAAQIESEVFYKTFFTGMTRQGVLFIWPVKLTRPDDRRNDWAISEREAAVMAMKQWVRVAANMTLGAYEVSVAEDLAGEPAWPELSFSEILKIAFKNKPLVDSMDHPAMKLLRGAGL